MCDYSLHNVASRSAKVGDTLVTTTFNSYSRGFAAIGEPKVAVCLLPGTEVAFEKDVEHQHIFARLLSGKLGQIARFRRINIDQPGTHHDALEFANGKIVLLTRLCPGQRATVLQLPAQAHVANEAEEHKLPELVS